MIPATATLIGYCHPEESCCQELGGPRLVILMTVNAKSKPLPISQYFVLKCVAIKLVLTNLDVVHVVADRDIIF